MFVDEMERGDKPMCAISRKHAYHLESYFKRYFAQSNARTTLHDIRHKDEQLRKDLRETADHSMVGQPSAPVRPPRFFLLKLQPRSIPLFEHPTLFG